MKNNIGLLTFLITFKIAKGSMESYITGGDFVKYSQYPHSIYLKMDCGTSFACGASVLNQNIVLTAGHCLDDCKKLPNETVEVRYGHENIFKMKKTIMQDFIIHERYKEFKLANDIALVLTREEIPLNGVVKRVILIESPPIRHQAFVAGWGNDETNRSQIVMKHTHVSMQNEEVCKVIKIRPQGTFCAGPIDGLGTPSKGDSGSAMVIDEYIQIGLVSFRVLSYSLVVYTNVSYFLDWIKGAANLLMCEPIEL